MAETKPAQIVVYPLLLLQSACDEEESLVTVDVPYVPAQECSMVMAQVSNEYPVVNPKAVVDGFVITQRDEEIVSFCKDVGTFDSFVQGFNAYSPIDVVMERLGYRWNSKTSKFNAPVSVTSSIKTSVLVPPKHGRLEKTFAHTWGYRADSGYEGKDQVVYLVEVAGRRFRVISNLLVREGANEFESECDKAQQGTKTTGGSP